VKYVEDGKQLEGARGAGRDERVEVQIGSKKNIQQKKKR
jgi:hypothetical protein